MPAEETTFEQVFNRWDWKPINNCPGRFTLVGGRSTLRAEALAGIDIKAYKFRPEKIPDEVLVVPFSTGGGLISYLKADAQFLHTLNDPEGFARKLGQLEISLPDDAGF